jgi:hypothetical protein
MAPSFPNFRNDSNSDYPKSSLTLISEYQKLSDMTRPPHDGRFDFHGLETVIASEAKQSSYPRRKAGLLRRVAPRNDRRKRRSVNAINQLGA